MRKILLFLFIFVSLKSYSQKQIVLQGLKAFPTAEGFGKVTTAGRSGEVYHVTTLANEGEGSLRWGIKNAPRPCSIVFDVSGYIDLTDENGSTIEAFKDRLLIDEEDGNLSILGQTAPQGGITIRDASVWIEGTNELIMRHIRIRPGAGYEPFSNYPSEDDDALVIKAFGNGSGGNIVLDHLSVSWGEDGVFDMGGQSTFSWSKITVQNCMFYENWKSGYISLLSGRGGYEGVSILRNYWANGSDRHPIFSLQDSPFEFINNISYYGSRLHSIFYRTQLDFIGNIAIENPNFPKLTNYTIRFVDRPNNSTNPRTAAIYFHDNKDTNEPDGNSTLSTGTLRYEVNEKQFDSGYIPIPSLKVYATVMQQVGSFWWDRDAADDRVVNDSKNLTGGRIFDEDEVGGFPVIPENKRPQNFYASNSHISQAFYDEHNLSGDGTDVTVNWDFGTYTVVNDAGYTDREMYWAWLARDFDDLEGTDVPDTICPGTDYIISASASDGSNVPCNLVDNNLSTRWGAEGDGEWAMFDLGSVQGVDQVQIAFLQGDSRTAFFNLQVSNDAVNWIDVFGSRQQSSGATLQLQEFDFPLQNARYVRYLGHGNSVNDWNSLLEMRVNTGPVAGCPNSPYGITASDSEGANVPCNLVDGDLSTRWGAEGNGEWAMFDLGSVREVNQLQVAFFNGNSRTAYFDVQVSNDAATWSDVYGERQQSSGTTLQLQDFDFPLRNARYVRYLGHGNSVNSWNSLLEMRVNRTSGPVADCPGSPYRILASDSDGANVPCNLVDDNLGTRWGANGDGQWAMFDLGSVREVNQMQVAFFRGDSRTAYFDVQISNNATTWTDVYGSRQQSSGTTLQLQDFDFPLQNARYVRYLGHGNSQNDWNSLQEMRVNRTVNPQEVTLEPIHDAYLQGSTRYNNELLKVEEGNRTAYIKYDLSQINGEITGAELRFRIVADTGSGTAEVHKGSNTDWTETNLSNSNRPSETALLGSTTDLGQTSSDVVAPLSTGSLSGGGTLSLIVRQPSGNDFAFASKESATGPAPRLVLTYRPATNLRARNAGTIRPDDNLLRLYPNPTTDKVNIEGVKGRKDISIMDFSGKVLYSTMSSEPEPELNLSGYAPGSYFIRVVGQNDSKTFTVLKK